MNTKSKSKVKSQKSKLKIAAGAGFSLLAIAIAAGAARHGGELLDPQSYLAHVKFLASENMRGRATGSPELEKAAGYISKQFKMAGLQPFEANTYLQSFPVTTNAKLGPDNRFEYVDGGKTTALKFQEDFVPFNFSSRAKVSGHVVFAGYGITAREYN
jgi:hypothetical protein